MLKETEMMVFAFILVPLSIMSIILFYVLWINGYLIKSRKTAILFIGSYRKEMDLRQILSLVMVILKK